MLKNSSLLIGLSLVATTAVTMAARADGPALPKGLPADLWEVLVPQDSPVTADRVALGRRLFYDKRLSKDATVSCASCHAPDHGFADPRKVSEGVGGKKG